MITIGRFAPTPSGPLHEGSLQTATASWLSARRQQGLWLLRIDDLDAARCLPGASTHILQQLDAYGLHWDGQPHYQSQHLPAYRAARRQLEHADLIYTCDCTRAQRQGRLKGAPAAYDQHCWRYPHPPVRAPALRLFLDDAALHWHDQRQGAQQSTRDSLGDPVIWRADNVPGYALACAVDEGHMRITEVVRGEDLLTETAPQVYISRVLSQALPQYRHLPLVMDAAGRKMSKQNHAAPLADDPAGRSSTLARALERLGYGLPDMMRGASPEQLLDWALGQTPHG